MEEKKKITHRLWRLILLALLILAVIAAVMVYLIGIRGVSSDADDPRAILAEYDPDAFSDVTLLPDGRLAVTLVKEDLYWFAGACGLTEPVENWLRGDANLLSAGFRLSGGGVNISISRKALGILPLSYRAKAELSLRDGALCLQTREVRLGSRIALPESQWPELFRRELTVDLSGTDFAPELESAELWGGELRLILRGLTGSHPGTLRPDADTAGAMRLFGLASLLPDADTVTAEELCARALDSGDTCGYLAREMSLCEADTLSVLWRSSSAVAMRWLWEPQAEAAERCRQELEQSLAECQSPYEKLLLAVREAYRSGGLGIWETGFYNPATLETVHPGTLCRLDVTAIDSRIVFLTTAGDEAAPEEMPDMLSVPRKNWLTMDKDLDWRADVDLGVLLTTEGEVPILLYRRGDGTLVLREVTEELYVSAMVSRTAPQIDLDALPPMTVIRRPAGEGFTGAVIGYLEK